MLRKASFPMAVALAMGFGASQALATPADAPTARLCTTQEDIRCADKCRANGADGGYCDPLAPAAAAASTTDLTGRRPH
jgi:hypothetical protein